MWKIQFRKDWESVELLELKPNRFSYNVQKELEFYNISVPMDGKQIAAILNDVIDVDLKKKTEGTRGRVFVQKGWKGKYYSIKNIRFHITDFLLWGLELAPLDGKSRILVCITILLELIKQLGVDLGKNEMAVCVALYRVSKRHILTEDNVAMYIGQELQEGNYGGPEDEKEIYESLSTLINMGIVSIEDGRYEVTQEVCF